jgi:hypothetical protein
MTTSIRKQTIRIFYFIVQFGLCVQVQESLIKSFDKLRTNGKLLIPFVVSLSNHDRNQLVQRFPYVFFAAFLKNKSPQLLG